MIALFFRLKLLFKKWASHILLPQRTCSVLNTFSNSIIVLLSHYYSQLVLSQLPILLLGMKKHFNVSLVLIKIILIFLYYL